MYAITEAPPDTEERTPLVQEVEEEEEVADGVTRMVVETHTGGVQRGIITTLNDWKGTF